MKRNLDGDFAGEEEEENVMVIAIGLWPNSADVNVIFYVHFIGGFLLFGLY